MSARPAITKHEVIAFHRTHPGASVTKAAAALGCKTQYISTTARRNGLKFPRETIRKPRKSLAVPRSELTVAMLRDGLFYDPESGAFYWKAPRSKIVVGSEAGTLQSGYRMIHFCGVDYHAHRLAWLYMFGCWPAGDIDHVNRNRLDNRIANLRSATRSQNMANAGLSSRNTSGFKGVSLHRKANRWMAYIKVGGTRKYLGMHPTPEAAALAYDRAAIKYFGEFARTNAKILESVQSHEAAVVSAPAGSAPDGMPADEFTPNETNEGDRHAKYDRTAPYVKEPLNGRRRPEEGGAIQATLKPASEHQVSHKAAERQSPKETNHDKGPAESPADEISATDHEPDAPTSRPEPAVNPAGHIDTPATGQASASTDGGAIGGVKAQGRLPDAAGVEPSPSEPIRKSSLRPLCRNPENCGGYGSVTCHACLTAARESEATA